MQELAGTTPCRLSRDRILWLLCRRKLSKTVDSICGGRDPLLACDQTLIVNIPFSLCILLTHEPNMKTR